MPFSMRIVSVMALLERSTETAQLPFSLGMVTIALLKAMKLHQNRYLSSVMRLLMKRKIYLRVAGGETALMAQNSNSALKLL